MPEGVGYASSNVVAATGLELNYIQDRVFAYSGDIACSSTTYETHLDFTTGNQPLRITIVCIGGTVAANVASGELMIFRTRFNGIDVANVSVKNDTNEGFGSQTFDMIVPPYTSINVAARANGDTATSNVVITGKVL